MARQRSWSAKKVRGLGVTTDVVTAGSVLGIGRTNAYQMVREGRFPVPVRTNGRRYVVMVADLLHAISAGPNEQREPRDDGSRPEGGDA